ncbi:hypothetical protein AB0O34_05040 [Sphaerisporangium sp. NPDC088356]|uniref:hypothetical protein n=1 Tax=Sphaerisporangium sp. NPDC088356 TaxID=3154871 RepID=UPI003440F21F
MSRLDYIHDKRITNMADSSDCQEGTRRSVYKIVGAFPSSKLFPAMLPDLAALTLDSELRQRGYLQDTSASGAGQPGRSVRMLHKNPPGILFTITAQDGQPNIVIIGKTECFPK